MCIGASYSATLVLVGLYQQRPTDGYYLREKRMQARPFDGFEPAPERTRARSRVPVRTGDTVIAPY